jgi:GNAT superfamily N-acetyltransferase
MGSEARPFLHRVLHPFIQNQDCHMLQRLSGMPEISALNSPNERWTAATRGRIHPDVKHGGRVGGGGLNSEAVHRHIAAMARSFSAAGYSTMIGNDADAYRAHVADLVGYNVSTPLNSQFSTMHPSRFLWLRVSAPGGITVAVQCARLVLAPAWRGGLRRMLLSQQLFADRTAVLPVISQAPGFNMAGRLVYLGGGWVHPDHRGKGIMSLAVRLTAAHALRLWNWDHCFALLRSNHLSLALQPTGYGFTAATQVPNAYWSGSAAPEDLFLVSSPQSAVLRVLGDQSVTALTRPKREN